jgi:LysR family hydrogen peroxide-inducible transcriptional activator
MITLRQLRYLDALAETLHFGEAAEACAVSQPALSMQIRELEEVLEVSLVERRKSGVELTEQGEEIVRRGRTILSSVRDLLDYAKHRERVLSGTLKLGVIPSIAPYLLPDALPELKRRFPELNLQLRETITETLIHELGSGVLDLILIALPIDDPELETLHLFDDKFVLASHATKNHKRSREAALDVLAHERLLLLEEGHCLRDQALSFCRLVTPEARESFGASSLATVVQMVAHGYGITLLPEMAVASEVHDRKDIRLQHFPAPEPKREIGLAWRKTSPRKADFHAFAALLKDASRHRVKS